MSKAKKKTTDAIKIMKAAHNHKLNTELSADVIALAKRYKAMGLDDIDIGNVTNYWGLLLLIRGIAAEEAKEAIKVKFASATALLKSAKSLDGCLGQFPKTVKKPVKKGKIHDTGIRDNKITDVKLPKNFGKMNVPF
jgi:hypothetical protein